MKIIKRALPKEIKQLTIIPLSDLHLGDANCRLDEFLKAVEKIKEEKDTYCIINGDICNFALKNSVSDVYSEELTPMGQITKAIDILKPIKDKILVMSSGNHEDRVMRNDGFDPLYLVACQLGIEDVYANALWVLYVSFGLDKNHSNRHTQMTYCICGYHGSGSGATYGGKINKLVRTADVIKCADLYIVGHTHTPIATKETMYVPDYQNRGVMKKESYFLMTNAFVDYDGSYAEKMGLRPSATSLTEAQLCGTERKIKVCL